MALFMKRIFKIYLFFTLSYTFVYTQNIGAYLGTPPSSSITANRGDFSFNINYTTFYSFNQNSDIITEIDNLPRHGCLFKKHIT